MNEKVKPSYNEERHILGKAIPLETPYKLIIDSSEACNFRCNYCFRADENKENWGYAKKSSIMSWELFQVIVNQIKEFPEEIKQISLSCHGEPLCNPRLPEMVKYLKENEIQSKISIHTNASLLQGDYIERLASSEIDNINISLQGLSTEKYRSVCGAGIEFEKFYENLKKFYERKENTQVSIKIVDVALEEGEDKRFYELFEKVADRVFIEEVVPIWKNISAKGESNIIKNKYGTSFKKQECCPILFHTLVVSPVGDVYPCTQLLGIQSLGNVNSKTLKACWNSDEKKELMKDQLKSKKMRMCQGCNILQNSIYTPEDMIDDYRNEILERIERNERG